MENETATPHLSPAGNGARVILRRLFFDDPLVFDHIGRHLSEDGGDLAVDPSPLGDLIDASQAVAVPGIIDDRR